jgi:uncharacterized protein YjaG (DUF416 family)
MGLNDELARMHTSPLWWANLTWVSFMELLVKRFTPVYQKLCEKNELGTNEVHGAS